MFFEPALGLVYLNKKERAWPRSRLGRGVDRLDHHQDWV